MKQVTLYNPKSDALRDYRGAPVSLLAISRFLKKEGYKIKILNHFDNLKEELDLACKESICFGITCMSGYQIKDALKIVEEVRKKHPKLPLVWGGWHPSILPDQTIKNEYVDIVVRGQGERTFTELVHALEKKESLEKIKGITYKQNGKIIINPEREIEDLNNFPELPYDLLDIKKHFLNSEFGERTINYYASQGCPFRCAFCADPGVYKRRWYGLKPERIVSEFNKLKKTHKIDSVIFFDSNFFVSEKHTKEFCERAIKTKLNLKFGQVDGRSNVLARYSEETWKLMEKAGFVNILNGTESGSQDVLDFITKDATLEDTLNLVKLCKKYNITLVCSTFIGLPTKNIAEEFKINLDFIDSLMKISDKNTYYLLIYTPYPGNPMYDLSIKQGLIPPDNLEKWAEFELHNVTTPWVSKKYGPLCEQLNVFYFPFLGNQMRQIINHYPLTLRFPSLIIYHIIRTMLKIRWRLRFFKFPVEYTLFRYLPYIKDKISRMLD